MEHPLVAKIHRPEPEKTAGLNSGDPPEKEAHHIQPAVVSLQLLVIQARVFTISFHQLHGFRQCTVPVLFSYLPYLHIGRGIGRRRTWVPTMGEVIDWDVSEAGVTDGVEVTFAGTSIVTCGTADTLGRSA